MVLIVEWYQWIFFKQKNKSLLAFWYEGTLSLTILHEEHVQQTNTQGSVVGSYYFIGYQSEFGVHIILVQVIMGYVWGETIIV